MAAKYLDEVLTRAPGAWIQATDPAVDEPTWMAVDVLWIDTTATPPTLKKRNATNDGWDTLGKIYSDADLAGGLANDSVTNAKLAEMAALTIKGNATGSTANPTDISVADVQAMLAAARINAQTGTSYSLQASDNGKVVTLSNAATITLTVPSGLGAGFNCLIVQKGAGQVTFTPSSTTVNNRQSHTKTAGQHAVCSLVADVADNFYLGGDTAA